MPTIDVEYAQFERLLGLALHRNMDMINEVLAYVKGELKDFNLETDVMSIEIKDTGRPDLWNIEGLVRALRSFLNLPGVNHDYRIREPLVDVYVDPRLNCIRPYIGCSVIKQVDLNDGIIRGLMHMQEKLDHTFGRNRQKMSIGLYDFSLISSPLNYTVAKPSEASFIPLGCIDNMSLKEILEHHPKGIEYGHIVDKFNYYPLLLDAKKKVMSFPPIINSDDLGRVTEKTENLLVEVTGTKLESVHNTLKIVTLSLIDRGGTAYAAKIHYPDRKSIICTPNLESKTLKLSPEYVNKITGLALTCEETQRLLLKAGYKIESVRNNTIPVKVPCYRVDVMHQIDLVEDVAIAYGYDNLEPVNRKLATIGSLQPKQRILNIVRELMIGLGFQEILSYTLTNPDKLFKKMNLKKQKVIEIANPKVQNAKCLRNWLLPSLMDFLSNNLSVEFPQKIFELGLVTEFNQTTETKTKDEHQLAATVSHANANFSEIKSALDALILNLNLEWTIKVTQHPSFIHGRVGNVIIADTNCGIVGELNPEVLVRWGLENPCVAFIINIEKISEFISISQN